MRRCRPHSLGGTVIVAVLATLFEATFSASVRADIIAGPVVNPANGHTYYLLTSQSWTASQAEAVTLGGNLVTLNDAAEDAWVFDTFATPTRMLWIGLNDVQIEGTFVWASGEPVTYTNWAPGEPQGGQIEDWVAIRTQAIGPARLWIDWQDNGNFFGVPVHGVVEVPTAVPEPSSFALIACGAAVIVTLRRRAHLNTVRA